MYPDIYDTTPEDEAISDAYDLYFAGVTTEQELKDELRPYGIEPWEVDDVLRREGVAA